MKENIILIAIDCLGISREEAEMNCERLPDINAYYFWNNARGGRSMIIDTNGEKLIAASMVDLDKHIQAFVNGRRN